MKVLFAVCVCLIIVELSDSKPVQSQKPQKTLHQPTPQPAKMKSFVIASNNGGLGTNNMNMIVRHAAAHKKKGGVKVKVEKIVKRKPNPAMSPTVQICFSTVATPAPSLDSGHSLKVVGNTPFISNNWGNLK